MGEEPKFEASQPLPDMLYAEVAKMAGLHGVRVGRPEGPAALDTALAADLPCVLDVLSNAEAPTLPPHVELDQAPQAHRGDAQGRRPRRPDDEAGSKRSTRASARLSRAVERARKPADHRVRSTAQADVVPPHLAAGHF
jgi:hypothetical protein